MKKYIITLSIAAATSVFAANLPTSGDIQRQVQQPTFDEGQKALPSIKQEYKAPMAISDAVTMHVKGFTFSGNTVYSSEELKALLKPYEDKELGLNGLNEVTSIITKYYRDHNYFVARAYIPEQKIKDGIVEIAIVEGIYGNFTIKNNSLVGISEIQGYMNHLKSGQIVSTTSLERQMLLINDLSGVQVVSAEVYPGSTVGTSDFAIATAATDKYSGYAVLDNYGSRYTGEARTSVGVNINSLTEVGDTLTASGMLSHTANLKNAGVTYERPIGYSGLKANINASTTRYTLDHITNYDAYGTANIIGAGVSYPTIKTRSHTQTLSLDYTHRSMADDSGIPGNVEESKKSTDALMLSFSDRRSTDLFNNPGKLFMKASLTAGHVNLGNDVAKTNDASIDTEGGYSKANIVLSYTHQFTPELSLLTSIKAQKSFGKNLDSSEDISVGGSNGIRAYEDSELSGDQGVVASIDLMYALPKMEQISHYTSLFVDSAKVWKNANVYNTEDNTRNINAVGIGYGLNYKLCDLRASFAHGFGGDSTPTSEAEFSTNKNKFLVQGMIRF